MGVRGLKSFVENNNLLENYTLKRKAQKQPTPRSDSKQSLSDAEPVDEKVWPHRVVIDGRSMLHFLYRGQFDCVLGGHYSAFKTKIKDFIKSFEKYDLEIVAVVIDRSSGSPELREKILEDMLKDTRLVASVVETIQRGPYRSRIPLPHEPNPPLPLLCMCVLMDTLREMDVPLYLTQTYGDQSVAYLAEHFHAFVLAFDTDYMIYPLTTGYLPFTDFDLQAGTCTVYRVGKLSARLNLPIPFLKLYAVAMGTGYFDHSELRFLYPRVPYHLHKRLHAIVLPVIARLRDLPLAEATDAYLRHFRAGSHGDGPSYAQWRERFVSIMGLYTLDAQLSEIQPSQQSDPYGYARMVPKFRFFRCDVMLEDLAQASAWQVSRKLRQLCYARFASLQEVVEAVRNQAGEIEERPVRVPQSLRGMPALVDALVDPFDGDALLFAVQFLMEHDQLTVMLLMAVALAATPAATGGPDHDDMEDIEMHLHRPVVHALACLEATMVSWCMATQRLLVRLVDGPALHRVYHRLTQLPTKVTSMAIETLAHDDTHAARALALIQAVLGDDWDTSTLAEDKEHYWIVDWN